MSVAVCKPLMPKVCLGLNILAAVACFSRCVSCYFVLEPEFELVSWCFSFVVGPVKMIPYVHVPFLVAFDILECARF